MKIKWNYLHQEYRVINFWKSQFTKYDVAMLVCKELGVSEDDFLKKISSFKGASKRLELVKKENSSAIYKDFAHSPSKLKATSTAMIKQFSDRKLVACIELHTFSSLNEEFLSQYKGSMDGPDTAIVYFSPESIAHKKLNPITKQKVYSSFGRKDLLVFTDSNALEEYLKSLDSKIRIY